MRRFSLRFRRCVIDLFLTAFLALHDQVLLADRFAPTRSCKHPELELVDLRVLVGGPPADTHDWLRDLRRPLADLFSPRPAASYREDSAFQSERTGTQHVTPGRLHPPGRADDRSYDGRSGETKGARHHGEARTRRRRRL